MQVLMCAVTALAATNRPPSVIFRLDDVQDWFKAAAAREVLSVFNEEGAGLSIGVIGGSNFGQDPQTVRAVREAVAAGSEVFNHGPDASTNFDEIDTTTAKQRIAAGELAEYAPYTSFVPHQNRWADSTLEALEQLGYKVLSASVGGAYPIGISTTDAVWRLGQSTQTADYGGGEWPNTVADVLPRCETEIAAHGVCVVMMHPQEFDLGTVTYAELRQLIRAVRARGWEVTTFKGYFYGPTPEPPTTQPPACSAVLYVGETCHQSPRCCATGLTCDGSEWWATCKVATSTSRPPMTTTTGNPTTTTTTTTETTATTEAPQTTEKTTETTTSSPSECTRRIPKWGGCRALAANECCAAGLACVFQSQWWSACL